MDVVPAAKAATPMLGADTLVLAIQNGIGSAERIAAVLGAERVAIGVAGGFGASIVEPGHVHHNGWELVRLGERGVPATERIRRVAKTWADAGFRVEVHDDVEQVVWEKLVCNVAFSGTCTVLERPIGDVLDDESAWHVASACAREAYEVARARGIAISFDEPAEYVRAFGDKIRGAKPSMLLDLLAGRPGEVDVINGAIPPAARDVGLTAPVNETVTALVKAKFAC
jgi:2-dehydropantoate 2-reductase